MILYMNRLVSSCISIWLGLGLQSRISSTLGQLILESCVLFVLDVSGDWHTMTAKRLGLSNALFCTWMGDRIGMSISADSPLDETLNRGAALAATV